ncbi:MAG: BrnT family toxin [bacterium]|nr:BrnT family toxin [bacterium]
MNQYEWDEDKNQSNRKKHGISFDDAVELFENHHLRVPTSYTAEQRELAIGILNGVAITIVFTMRRGVIRVISARRSKKIERTVLQDWIERSESDEG